MSTDFKIWILYLIFGEKVPLTHKKTTENSVVSSFVFQIVIFCVSNPSFVLLRFVVYTLERLLYFQIYLSYAATIIFGILGTSEICVYLSYIDVSSFAMKK